MANDKPIYEPMPDELQEICMRHARHLAERIKELSTDVKAAPGDQDNRDNQALSCQIEATAYALMSVLADLIGMHPDKPVMILFDAMMDDLRNRSLRQFAAAAQVAKATQQ